MTFDAAVERLRTVTNSAARLTATLPNGVPDIDAARARLAEGLPALAGEPLIAWETLEANAIAIGADVESLRAHIDGQALVECVISGTWDAIPDNDSLHETITLLDLAARPALRAGFAATRELIDAATWTRGTCPACGALPLVAELRGKKDGESRTLRCGRCTAAWSFPRLACPACDERDHRQLRYIHVDGEVDHRRAECCTTCGFYVKAVARLDPIDAVGLMTIDLDTIALDVLALDAGYRRRSLFAE